MNNQEQLSELLNQLTRQMYQDHDPAKPTVTICLFEDGEGLEEVNLLKAFEKAVKKRNVKINVDMMETAINEISAFGPVVILSPTNQSLTKVRLLDVDNIIDHFVSELKKSGLFFVDQPPAAEELDEKKSQSQSSDPQKNTLGDTLLGAFLLGLRKLTKKRDTEQKTEIHPGNPLEKLSDSSKQTENAHPEKDCLVQSVKPDSTPHDTVIKAIEATTVVENQSDEKVASSSDFIRLHSFSFDAKNDAERQADEFRETELSVCPEFLPVLIPGTLKIRPPHELDQLGLERISDLEQGTVASLKAEKNVVSKSLMEDSKVIAERSSANAYEAEFLTVSHLFSESPISEESAPEISAEIQPNLKEETGDTEKIKFDIHSIHPLLKKLISDQEGDDQLPCISVCLGDGCMIQGSQKVFEEFQRILASLPIGKAVVLKRTGCSGFCGQGPLVMLLPAKVLYVNVKPEDVQQIVDETLMNGNLIRSLLYRNPENQKIILLEKEIPFFSYQTRVLTESEMDLDPESLEDYICHGGYQALVNALSSDPDQIIEEIKKANLRGRGGAGFPTWKKLDSCRSTESETKYVIVNGDAGDPGSIEDQALMCSNPHLILEGLIIGAYAVHASKGYLYIRKQYASAVKMMEKAIHDAAEHGLVGNNILNSGYCLDVVIQPAAGAYISGEEMNLIHAMEGLIGEPGQKPPYPAVSGLRGKPTVVCNVKTWSCIPFILNYGAEWFSRMGSVQSSGTTLVSLTGAVSHPGIAEIQLGMSIKTLVEKIGGVPIHHPIKAVQVGSPFGPIIPVDQLDIPYDYIQFEDGRAFLGSVIHSFPENSCMVQEVQNRLKFAEKESCGSCVVCLAGIPLLISLLDSLLQNKAEKQTLVRLKEIAIQIQIGAKCNFGKNVPVMVLSSMNAFAAEYESHCIGECPGGRCQAFSVYLIDTNRCSGCGRCQQVCPTEAIAGSDQTARKIDATLCVACGLCFQVCDDHAVHYQKRE